MKVAAIALLCLAACSAPIHTADWYADHPHETAAALDRCLVHGETERVCAAAADGNRLIQQRRLDALRKTF